MATAREFPFPIRPVPGGGQGALPAAPDPDDGIHIASVTRVERASGAILRVVVSWQEDGCWVAKVVEVPEGPDA